VSPANNEQIEARWEGRAQPYSALLLLRSNLVRSKKSVQGCCSSRGNISEMSKFRIFSYLALRLKNVYLLYDGTIANDHIIELDELAVEIRGGGDYRGVNSTGG